MLVGISLLTIRSTKKGDESNAKSWEDLHKESSSPVPGQKFLLS